MIIIVVISGSFISQNSCLILPLHVGYVTALLTDPLPEVEEPEEEECISQCKEVGTCAYSGLYL